MRLAPTLCISAFLLTLALSAFPARGPAYGPPLLMQMVNRYVSGTTLFPVLFRGGRDWQRATERRSSGRGVASLRPPLALRPSATISIAALTFPPQLSPLAPPVRHALRAAARRRGRGDRRRRCAAHRRHRRPPRPSPAFCGPSGLPRRCHLEPPPPVVPAARPADGGTVGGRAGGHAAVVTPPPRRP